MATELLRTDDLRFLRNGDWIKAYGAWLRCEERVPAVVIIPDVHGLSEHYRDLARRLANEGFFALALDLYAREGAPQIDDAPAAMRWMQQLDDRRVLADIDSAVRFLGSRPEVRARSIGITGFCMGGQYALMAACTVPNLQACVSFYGMLRYVEKTDLKPQSPLEVAKDLACPFLGLFGEDDPLIPRADVKELESILRRSAKVFQTKIYPAAGHAFCNDTRPDSYRPEAAKDAWTRAIAFFRKHLEDN
jgi:carboxymethylenebutenolidase